MSRLAIAVAPDVSRFSGRAKNEESCVYGEWPNKQKMKCCCFTAGVSKVLELEHGADNDEDCHSNDCHGKTSLQSRPGQASAGEQSQEHANDSSDNEQQHRVN